jgi:hypothetical protein
MFVSTVRFSCLALAAVLPSWLSAQTPAPVAKPTAMPATTTATMIAPAAPAPVPVIKPQVSINTSMGEIVIELDPARAPVTVDNFMKYVKSGFYDGTIFHRVIPGFMIQGGGYMTSLAYKPTRDAIKSEANNGLKTFGKLAVFCEHRRQPVFEFLQHPNPAKLGLHGVWSRDQRHGHCRQDQKRQNRQQDARFR